MGVIACSLCFRGSAICSYTNTCLKIGIFFVGSSPMYDALR